MTKNIDAQRKLKAIAERRGTTVARVLGSFDSSTTPLEFRRDAVDLELVGFFMAARDGEYIDEVSRIGKDRGLDDPQAFQAEANRLMLGNHLYRLILDLGWEAALQDDAELQIRLATLDGPLAVRFAEAVTKDQADRAAMKERARGPNK